MGIQQWLNENDGKNQSTWKKICPSATLVHHKSHMDWPGIKPRPLWQNSLTACTQYWPAKENGILQMDMKCIWIVTLTFNEHIMLSACLLSSNDHAQDACYWSLTNPLGCTSSTTPMIQGWWCGVVCLVTWLWIHTSSQGMWTNRDMGRQSAYLHYFKNGIFFQICQVTFALQNSWKEHFVAGHKG